MKFPITRAGKNIAKQDSATPCKKKKNNKYNLFYTIFLHDIVEKFEINLLLLLYPYIVTQKIEKRKNEKLTAE